MAETIESITVSTEETTLAKLIWRRFKTTMPGLVERTLDLNPGLAALGEVLPLGTVVRLPVPEQRAPEKSASVRLW